MERRYPSESTWTSGHTYYESLQPRGVSTLGLVSTREHNHHDMQRVHSPKQPFDVRASCSRCSSRAYPP